MSAIPTNTYLPAILKHNAHGWTIEYHVIDPGTAKMKRYAVKLNKLRKRFVRLSDFKAFANNIVQQYNVKLSGGWTPFGESQNSRIFSPMNAVIHEYIAEKGKELRPDSMRSYKSFCKTLENWIDNNVPGVQIGAFNKLIAVKFMDYLLNERCLSGKTWNNQLKAARCFFSWAIEKCYAKENPFENIKTKREEEKKRILIPADTRHRIADWCLENSPGMLVVCEMVYSALIRPKEITGVRLSDIDLVSSTIRIRSTVAKTHYERFATITPQLRELLVEMKLDGYNQAWFLFGKGYKPAAKPLVRERFSKDWIRIRDDLGLPAAMQLYSLRDTGINEMLHAGIDALSVMQAADHHDLAMTTRYANHANADLVRVISSKAPSF